MEEEVEVVAASDNVSETPDQATEQVDTPETETYDWVPKKYLVDGKPDFQNLAKSYTSLEKKLGSKGAMAPDTIDDYSYTPTSIDLDAESTASFKQEALAAGLSTKQYEFVMQKYEQEITNMVGTAETAEQTLKSEWGSTYTDNLTSARRAFDAYAPSDVSIEDPIFNHPAVLKLLARMGSDLQEDSAPRPGAAASSGMTQDSINEIMSSSDYYNNQQKQKAVADWFLRQYK